MKNALLVACCLFSLPAISQYYFNDVVNSKEMGERMKTYAENKVRMVTATGYDEMGRKTSDFNEVQEVFLSARTLKVSTRQGQTVTRVYYRFDDQFRLISVTDTLGSARSNSVYSWDNQGRLVSINSSAQDSLSDFRETEIHQYIYNSQGKPERMWRIINEKDSTEYRFTIDEEGNVADEQLFRRNVGFERQYYYYDEQGRLTDIVRYDKKSGQLLPDVMFEYDDKDRVIQKINTMLSSTSRSYLIWRYLFNEKGLKTKEALFNKQKEQTGKIEYAYSYQP